MQYTTNFNLKKPSTTDKYSVGDFNSNADTIDSELYAVKTKEATDRTNLAALQSQVDNIVAASGSTEGNAELQDIRLGADGVTYQTAGLAVRTQIGAITALIDALGIYVDADGNICQH